MLTLLARHVQDPDRAALHRGLRIAIVLPLLFAFGLHVLDDPQFALVAAFGAFAALGMADFMGPRRSRLMAHVVLAVAGMALVVLGTGLSNTLWPAVIAMLAIGFAFQFAMALGGQFALGNNAAILAFVVAVMVPGGVETIPSRVAGWLTAMVCSALVATFLWPRHERRDLYQRIAEACRALAAVARAAATGSDSALHIEEAGQAIERVRAEQGALGFRPIGPPAHQQALLGIIDALSQGWRFSRTVVTALAPTESDRDLARAVSVTLDGVAGVAAACAEGRRGAAPDLEGLIEARHAHLAQRHAAAAQALASNAPGAVVVGQYTDAFPLRVLSYITLAMGVDASVMTGRTVRVQDDFVVVEATAAEGAIDHTIDVLTPHLSPGSVWFRNCARAGLALALAVLVAKASDISHAFWVVLATLSVLRSNAVTTGATAVSALAGVLAGFALATVAILILGPYPMALWLSLPVFVFLAGFAPQAISFGAGQAMFALLVVALFNLMVPEGWEVGAVRVEAVAVGAVVALVTSLIMWPKGASAALREEVALHVRAAQRLLTAAFGGLVGRVEAAQLDAARADTQAARHRSDEAFASYLGERGTKRVPLVDWSLLTRVPIAMRVAADAAIAMQRSGYGGIEAVDAARLFREALGAVSAAYDELAMRLDHPERAADATLAATIADLNMLGGAGQHRAAILAAMAAYAEAHRTDAQAIARVMALALGLGWLGYLAHIRTLAEPPLCDVASHSDAPWWR